MTTAELARELSTLTMPELRQVKFFVSNLKKHRSTTKTMNSYSREELISMIEESYNQTQQGKTKLVSEFLAGIREEYGLSV